MLTDHQALVVIAASSAAVMGNGFLQVVVLIGLSGIAVLAYLNCSCT